MVIKNFQLLLQMHQLNFKYLLTLTTHPVSVLNFYAVFVTLRHGNLIGIQIIL